MAAYSPPFTLTHAMMSRVGSQVPMLRRENRIRTIQVSLAIGFDPIEHNTLSLEQVTAVIEGKVVLAFPVRSRRSTMPLRPIKPCQTGSPLHL